MLARKILSMAPVVGVALALAACDRPAEPADPSTGPIEQPAPIEDVTPGPDPSPDLVVEPNGDPLPPEAFEGEPILTPDGESVTIEIEDAELQQRLDDAVLDAQQRAREIAEEVLGGDPTDESPQTPAPAPPQ